MDDDLSSSYCYDKSNAQEDGMTPFAGDSFMMGDVKPFRNVIKRYWTEEEVSNKKLFTSFIG